VAAGVVGGDVDVVVPGGTVAVEEVLHPLFAGRDTGRVLGPTGTIAYSTVAYSPRWTVPGWSRSVP
jgi:translation initiation factor 2 gamma subunit (eIF-2gamma)